MAITVSKCFQKQNQAMLVGGLLFLQAMLLGYSATVHSPTQLEPAFLASGLANWEFSRYEAYRVNPPLVRMVAAIPILITGYTQDWRNLVDGPGTRAEYSIGNDFAAANGPNLLWLVVLARWACIPFSLLGTLFAYLWSRDLYGHSAGIVTALLYVFEPNLLGHGELITPDAACSAFGIAAGYTYWKWLRSPSWPRAFVAGMSLGAAELSKMSWLILFGIWPALWIVWQLLCRLATSARREITADCAPPVQSESRTETDLVCHKDDLKTNRSRSGFTESLRLSSQLLAILGIAIFSINAWYHFDESFTKLRDFEFVSSAFSHVNARLSSTNRFRTTWLGAIPVPLPKQYVLGIDVQQRDFEEYHHMSYLRGKWSSHGWWYYYLYCLTVKVPCGILALLAVVVTMRLRRPSPYICLRDELVLFAPPAFLFIIASSQTEFSIHFRYVLPALGYLTIFLGQSASRFSRNRAIQFISIGLVAFTIVATMRNYPHQLSYFNEIVGGSENGRKHLLGSNLDWGQGYLEAMKWTKENYPEDEISFEVGPYARIIKAFWKQPSQPLKQSRHRLAIYSAEELERFKSNIRSSDNHRQIEKVLKRFHSGSKLVLTSDE